MVTVPEVLFGTWLASVSDGLQDTDVAVVFEVIVPLALPKA